MKKKLIQILMLLVAAVSVGSFVSCKDTNEDLYNELRTQVIDQNASLQDALNQQQAALEDLLQKYKDLLATVSAIKSCDCDEAALEARLQLQIDGLTTEVANLWAALNGLDLDMDIDDIDGLRAALTALQTEINGLKGDVNGLQVDYAGLSSSFTSEIAGIKNLITLLQDALNGKVSQSELTAIIGGLTTQIGNIQDGLKALQDQNLLSLINTNKALQDGLEARIATLEAQLANIKSCECDYTDKFNNYDSKFDDVLQRLSKAEQAIIDNKAWLDQQLADIRGNVANAQTTADNALALANTANTNAQLALAEAQRIEGLANAAQAAADQAQSDATAAQQAAQAAQNAADLAYALAAQALNTANKVNDLAVTVATLTGKVEANEQAIAKLQQDTKDLRDLIDANKDKLQEAIDKVNGDLTGKIDDLKSDVQDKLDALKSEFQGKIDNLDGKLETKVNELTSAISQLSNSVVANAENIKANAQAIANNAEAIKTNAAAIDKIQDELKTINSNLTLATEKANQAYTEASEAKAKAETNAQSINDLKVAVGVNEASIKNLEKTTDELKDAVKDLLDKAAQIGVNTKAIEDLTATVNDMKEDLKDLYDKYDALKDQLRDVAVELATVKQECKDNFDKAKAYVDTEIATLKAGVVQMIADELKNYYDKDAIDAMLKDFVNNTTPGGAVTQEDLNQFTSDFYNKIIQLYKDMAAGDQAIGDKLYDLAQRVAANEQAIEDIDKVLQTMNERFNDMDARFVNRETIMAWLQDLYKTLNAKILAGDVNIDYDALIDQIKGDLIILLPNIINNTLGLEEGDVVVTKDDLDDLEDLLKDLIDGKADADDLADAILDLAALEARVKALEDGYIELTDDIKAEKARLWAAINNNFNTLNNKIGDLQTAVKTINSKLPKMQEEIDKLGTRMKAAEDKLNEIEPKVKTLRSDVDALQKYLGEQVTSITIQGTHNPMFGTFSIPANIQSNVLVAYYGKPDNKIEFPTTDDANYVRKEEALTDDDWNMIGGDAIAFTQKANKVLINEGTNGKAYAGKVYVTVNPTSANVAGLQLDIVNTQDEASLFKLTELKKSAAKLEFGYSRSGNGFYEAEAYVEKKDLDDVQRPFNEQAIKDLVKEAKDDLKDILDNSLTPGHTGLDELATKVYEVVRTLRLDRSGLKCPFDETVDDKGNKVYKNAVYSQYNLAATALKPISLEWGKSFNYVTVPGYERAEKMLAKINEKLLGFTTILDQKDVKKLITDLENLNIKEVTLEGLSDDLIGHFKITIDPSFTFEGVRYDLVMSMDVNVPVKFAADLNVGAGTALVIPAEYEADLSYLDDDLASNRKDEAFNNLKEQIKKPTIVVKNNDAGALTTALIVPVKNQDGEIKGFTQFPVELPTELTADGNINVNGATVAQVSGTTLVTRGYTQETMIDELYYSFDIEAQTFTYTKTVDLSGDIRAIWGKVDEAIGDVNDIIKQINLILDDALKLKDLIFDYEDKYTNLVEDYFGIDGKLHGYLDKINKIIVEFVNGINWQLGPYIVAEDVNGFKVLSTSKDMPTVMRNNKLRLYPTSKNMEIFCPFARKHVAVTNVFKGAASAQAGDGDCVAKLKAANTGEMNTVIDGTQRMIEVNGMVSGYTYEVAYSVLDFEGNISTRKTYIRIK